MGSDSKTPPKKRKSARRRLKMAVESDETNKELYREAQRWKRFNCQTDGIKLANDIARTKDLREQLEKMTPLQTRVFERQFRNLRRKPKDRNFTFAQKIHAAAFWRNKPRTYKLLSKFFAMPSLDTLSSTLNGIPIQAGVSKAVFQIIKKRMRHLRTITNKLCILIFDEVAIQDPSLHKDKDVAGVFMLRGIYKRWKQPVAFTLCKTSMEPDTLVDLYKEIVKEATNAGLYVIASVCDQGANNRKAIKRLIEETKTRALSEGREAGKGVIEIDGHRIVPLFDPPHLLKTFRNHLLTKNLKFKDITKVLRGPNWGKYKVVKRLASWSHVVEALRINQCMRRLPPIRRLKAKHVEPKRVNKMKVAICAQALSRTVAAFMYFWADPEEAGIISLAAVDTARLCELVDEVFDSVNGDWRSSSWNKMRRLVKPYSRHKPCWLKGKLLFQNMEFVGDQKRPPVLRGWVQTLNGFIIIKRTLASLGYNSFRPRVFNIDPIGSFFDHIREFRRRCANPTCKSFVSFYKLALMKNFRFYRTIRFNCQRDRETLLTRVKDFAPK